MASYQISLSAVTTHLSGATPLEAHLTPRYIALTACEVQRIDWDLTGNGLSAFSIVRGQSLSSVNTLLFSHTNIFAETLVDVVIDPRNWDPTGLYVNPGSAVNLSFTAKLSATVTGSLSGMSNPITIGPVVYTAPISAAGVDHRSLSNIHILKVRNTPDGNFYALQIDNKELVFNVT